MRRPRGGWWAQPRGGAALLVVLAVAACGRGNERSRAAGSALWIDGAGAALTIGDLAALEQGGIRLVFVDAARLDWQGGQPQLEPLSLPRLPRRTPATLVVRGDWPLDGGDAKAAARALVTALDAVTRGAEENGLAVTGWHLDLRTVPRDADVDLLKAVRNALEPTLQLSLTVPRADLADEQVAKAARSTDFFVAFLYGQREGEPDDAAAWDFQRVRAAAQQLDKVGEPYLLGIAVRGEATVVRGGADVGEIPGVTLADLAWNRALRLRHGFSLEGVDRQVYAFTADYPTRLGATALVPGDDVRVVGTSTTHVQELRRQLADWKLTHCLGQLFYRLPHADEGLSLGLASLTRAAGDVRSLPEPRVAIETVGRDAGRVIVRLTLENPSPEASDLGGVDSNFVEVQAVGGTFADVKPGGFYRYDLLAPGPGGRLVRTMSPVLVRLFVPVLAPGARLDSGPLVIRTGPGGLQDLLVRATFLAPYGGSADLGPVSWTKLPAPGAAPTPAAGAAPAARPR